MQSEPRAKKRKMEPHIGGDNCGVQESGQKALQKSLQISPVGSASGDFTGVNHQYVSVISGDGGLPANPENYAVLSQACELGDEWEHKYPIPLRNYPKKPIKTGNMFYDSIISDLELFGYKALQVISKGRSGTILLAQDLHKQNVYQESEYVPVAMKLNTGKSRRKTRGNWKTDMVEEMNILQEMHHPNVISWMTNISYQGRIGIIMEFCENGNLDQLLKMQDARFVTEPIARRYFRNIYSGLEYMHFQGVAHRDICTQNLLITRHNTIKIADFGHAVKFMSGDPLRNDECGTTGFQAPEIVAKSPYDPRLSDLWSLGCVLYVMCTGTFPVGLIRSEVLARASKEIPFPSDRVLRLSAELKYLLRGLLLIIPENRFTMNRVKFSEWVNQSENRVQIGNFHLIRQPRKLREGDKEREMKLKYEI